MRKSGAVCVALAGLVLAVNAMAHGEKGLGCSGDSSDGAYGS